MRQSAFCILLLVLSASCGGSHVAEEKTPASKSDIDLWEADSIAYRRWGSPESPYRDESRYIAFLDSLLGCDSLPDGLRERAEYRRRIAMLNRPGSTAADFRYFERHGEESRLHDLSSPLTLLLFYDPECPHCNDILQWFASSEPINRAIDEKWLTVIAVYAEGKRDVWDKTRNDLPENWLVGYDLTGILDNELYDLPAMPTPYLLDSEKRVILKDPDPRVVVGRMRAKKQ